MSFVASSDSQAGIPFGFLDADCTCVTETPQYLLFRESDTNLFFGKLNTVFVSIDNVIELAEGKTRELLINAKEKFEKMPKP